MNQILYSDPDASENNDFIRFYVENDTKFIAWDYSDRTDKLFYLNTGTELVMNFNLSQAVAIAENINIGTDRSIQIGQTQIRLTICSLRLSVSDGEKSALKMCIIQRYIMNIHVSK